MPHNIFLSAGGNAAPKQEEFITLFEKHLEANGLAPRCVGRNYFRAQRPLKTIEECMKDCAGAVVIAFERTHIERGFDRQGTPREVQLDGAKLPTVWNQIEAGMAYVLEKPLLVIVERGLKGEGLLEEGAADWYIQYVTLDRSDFTEPRFLQIFADWKHRVEEYAAIKEKTPAGKLSALDATELSVGRIVSSLKPAQLWGLLIAIATAVSAIAVTAYQIGSRVGSVASK